MYWYWQYLGWNDSILFFDHLYQSYGPWFLPEFCFRLISWEQIDRFSPNFVYALILTRSRLRLLHLIFANSYQSYGPWLLQYFDSAQYPDNKLTALPSSFVHVYALILTGSRLGLLHVILRSSIPELWSLIYARILTLLNILRTNWLENKLTDFHHIVYMHW